VEFSQFPAGADRQLLGEQLAIGCVGRLSLANPPSPWASASREPTRWRQSNGLDFGPARWSATSAQQRKVVSLLMISANAMALSSE
jgi:hypothetical protein